MKYICFVSSLLLLSMSISAHAHNVVSGVYADGLTIEGEIGFSNGEMAQAGFTVEVLDDSGNMLGTTETKEGGMFSFEASSAQKHVFRADLGAGHVANMVLEADELVDAVVVDGKAIGAVASSVVSSMVKPQAVLAGINKPSNTSTPPSVTVAGNTISTEELQSLIRSAVAQQVRPLQKEIRAYKEKVFFRDIAGGLGFIFGLFGVAAWASSRRKEKPS